MHYKGKTKSQMTRRGRFAGRTSHWKKAIVTPEGRRQDRTSSRTCNADKEHGTTMAIRKLKPMTPGTRWMSVPTFDEITKSKPEKSLIEPLRKTGGRNNTGRITSRHRGGGHKRFYRIIDFKRDKRRHGREGGGDRIRSEPLRPDPAALQYTDGERRYILAPDGVKVGDVLQSGPESEIKVGNSLPLASIPAGTFVHAVEIRPGKGAQIGRSAGTAIQLMAKEGKFAQLRLPSGEIRNVPVTSARRRSASVGNADHENISVGKAGRSRWLGIRPQSRGVVRIRSTTRTAAAKASPRRAIPHPVSPWGWHTKGKKTRSRQECRQASSSSNAGNKRYGRSLKKGPYVNVEAAGRSRRAEQVRTRKKSSRRGRGHPRSRPSSSATRSPCTTGTSSSRSTSTRAWWGTSSASSRRRGSSAAHPGLRREEIDRNRVDEELTRWSEARAINRYIGSSPRKMRLVIDLIRGKSVDEALTILHFSPKHAVEGRGEGAPLGGLEPPEQGRGGPAGSGRHGREEGVRGRRDDA